MPGGFNTARGLAQSERAEKRKEEREAKIASGEIVLTLPAFDLDAYEKSVTGAKVQRKAALKHLADKIDKFIDQARSYESNCLEFGIMGSPHEIAPWIIEMFGFSEKEIGQVFRKVRQGYNSDLSDERVLKFLHAWPSEEKLLKAFEEHRVSEKTF